MQRTQKFLDTRPHRDAGHQTEVIKRLAAAAVLENKTPAVSQNMVLNGPSTQVLSPYKKAHSVQDTTQYAAYVGGQAVAQAAKTPKASQIEQVCYSANVMPDVNDKLRLYPQQALIQAAVNAYGRGYVSCCQVCGEPAQFTTACPCANSGPRPS